MTRMLLCLALAVSLTRLAVASSSVTVAIDFEELPLDALEYYNGSDGAGGFTTRGAWFNNQNSGYWSGWAYSEATDTTTPGVTNQYSAITGSGFGSSAQYGVAYNASDAGSGGLIPKIILPPGAEPRRVQVTNTTYAALSMLHGDTFGKQFGGPSGSDPDYFLLTVEGRNSAETVLGSVDLYLADYRFSDSNADYILDQWTELDLSPLAGLGVEKLAFRLESSDNSIFGMNTPAYVAIDNLEIEVVAAPGDFDLNGTVDSLDLAIWQENYGSSSGVGFTDGDADGNDIVDARDFLHWQRNATPPALIAIRLPEPSGTVLTVGFVVLSAVYRYSIPNRHL